MLFSFAYSNLKVTVYTTTLEEIKSTSRTFGKKHDGKMYNVKCTVGESYLGQVTSVHYEVIEGPDKMYEVYLQNYKEEINLNILNYLNYYKYLQKNINSPLPVNCIQQCVQKWCQNTSTMSGAMLCYADCALECKRKTQDPGPEN